MGAAVSPNQLRYAEALALEKLHGARAPAYVAKRVAMPALAGDQDGVTRFREIAIRLYALAAAARPLSA